MMADVADFSEWKNHRRATGGDLLGDHLRPEGRVGIGGAIGGYLLDAYGYVPERGAVGARAARHPAHGEHLSGDRVRLCAICLAFYRIDKSIELEMSRELTERRNAFLPETIPTPVPSAP
jgi:Na+/melibiose symporter-like transporter